MLALALLCAVAHTHAAVKAGSAIEDLPYLVGTGIYDVTGPAAESTSAPCFSDRNFRRCPKSFLSVSLRPWLEHCCGASLSTLSALFALLFRLLSRESCRTFLLGVGLDCFVFVQLE